MSEAKNESTKLMWIYTAVSFTAIVLFLIFKPEWFWVALPFFGTYLVKALGVI
jgi:ABC-type Na+ efflux pump permease subunit